MAENTFVNKIMIMSEKNNWLWFPQNIKKKNVLWIEKSNHCILNINSDYFQMIQYSLNTCFSLFVLKSYIMYPKTGPTDDSEPWSSGLHPQTPECCDTSTVLWGTRAWTKGFVHARQAFWQISCVFMYQLDGPSLGCLCPMSPLSWVTKLLISLVVLPMLGVVNCYTGLKSPVLTWVITIITLPFLGSKELQSIAWKPNSNNKCLTSSYNYKNTYWINEWIHKI